MILIKTVRVCGFRGLDNIEVDLEPITVLTGMNNSGKTSFLKAIQIVFGNHMFLTKEDFHLFEDNRKSEIIIDVQIIPFDYDNNEQSALFNEKWEIDVFKEERIKLDGENSVVQFRTIVTLNELIGLNKQQFVLNEWLPFQSVDDVYPKYWYESDTGKSKPFSFDEIPFFYMDAQRDITEELKLKTSSIGKVLSKIEYSPDKIRELEQLIAELNRSATTDSKVLSELQSNLEQLNSTLDDRGRVEIAPFAKKLRDINKNISIYYGDGQNSFTMDYHGMGTRSWSSLLALKAFIAILSTDSQDGATPNNYRAFFPLVAIEEPESHLHPNAQKMLYKQISKIHGQKIISTHSPYIAACTELGQIRSFYKGKNSLVCGKFSDLDDEIRRKMKRQVINSKGEIFFSKVIILCEGETEEQALPIFFEHFFDIDCFNCGVDIINVGGYKNYYPYLKFATNFLIPWIIFSDADTREIENNVKSQIKKVITEDISTKHIIFLDEGKNFEKYLIDYQEINDDGVTISYIPEIEGSLKELHHNDYIKKYIEENNGRFWKNTKNEQRCCKCGNQLTTPLNYDYSDVPGYKKALYDMINVQKTKFAPIIAQKIVASGKQLPPKISELFESVRKVLLISGAV